MNHGAERKRSAGEEQRAAPTETHAATPPREGELCRVRRGGRRSRPSTPTHQTLAPGQSHPVKAAEAKPRSGKRAEGPEAKPPSGKQAEGPEAKPPSGKQAEGPGAKPPSGASRIASAASQPAQPCDLHNNYPTDRSPFNYAPPMTDGRRARGDRTRAAVLDTAVSLASVDGLNGITLGQLAAAHGVSKSGLFAHWRDKEDLQLAVVDRAREQWWFDVIRPALAAPRGIRQLWALHVQRMDFYERRVLPGGCFFATAVHEFDDHPGAVRDRIFDALRYWLRLLRNTATEAIAMGELRPETDAKQLAFEIQAIGVAVVTHSRLLVSSSAYEYSLRSINDRLRGLATDPTLLDEPNSNGEQP
ncbi:TetR/AcrR family transcriptional regulator [Phytomonospora endophytica]|uniref:AcrR family transcriptional regulator n=1 Tax=Phytomonospora endophytica TaxID=714109 RepID=A0A841FF98_9ACTN|nr:TetR/AcrR family transcriptional regulator [Phytomonospora endophytica]MBB6035991.1 AcrR family transcriptional regulator [Phytomonospora endophytica]GIG66897.1 hypothetical protein Pen01_31920 [Phytomonospora endophytica]